MRRTDSQDDATEPDPPLPVTIRVEDGTGASVVIGGQELGHQLAGFSVEHASGVPVVTIVPASPDIRVEGLAEVVVGRPPDPGEAAAAFLEAIDPGELERTALARMDLDGRPYGMTSAILRQLGEWARGD